MESKFVKLATSIIENYFICREALVTSSLSSGEIDYGNPFYVYYRDVNITYMKLNDDERLIIKNEFINPQNSKWWKDLYLAKEYRAIRRKAIANFVRLFYEIH